MRFKIVLILLAVMGAITICCKNEPKGDRDVVVEKIDTIVVVDTVEVPEVSDTLTVVE